MWANWSCEWALSTVSGLFGWLFNWKLRKFSCRMISNIANYLKYNYFLDGDGIDNATLWLWKFSDFCSRCTVGVVGDDIMFHILVLCKRPVNERQSYILMSSLIGWAHIQNNPSINMGLTAQIKGGLSSTKKGYKACVKKYIFIFPKINPVEKDIAKV